AAVVHVGAHERLAAVRLLVAVAVGVAGRAGPVAGPVVARDADVVPRADHAAAAAVVRVGGDVDLAAVALLVGVAVGVAGRAAARADAADARDRRHARAGAGDAAAAAVVRVGEDGRLAAVG